MEEKNNLGINKIPAKTYVIKDPIMQGELTGYASIDKPWLKYYKEGVTEVKIPDVSIYQAIKESNKNRLKKIALDLRNSGNNFEKGIEITYDKYFKRMEDIAKAYINMGLKPNDIVITVLPNIPESRMIIYGLNILGVTVYPVSPMISSGQLNEIISQNEVKNLVVFSQFYDKFESVLSNRNLNSVLYVTGMESVPKLIQTLAKLKDGLSKKKTLVKENVLFWDEFDKLKKDYKVNLNPYYNEDHVAVIVGTSGTTGVPKGVCLTDKNLNAIAIQHGLSGILDEEDTMLDALIQSIGYGISTMHYSTYYGYKNILIPELLIDRFPEVLCKTKPDHFTGGPVHYQNLVKSDAFLNGHLPSLKNLVSGGATLEKKLERELNKVDEGFVEQGKDPRIIVRQGFGATENGGCGAYAKPGAYKFGGIGIPLPFDTISIFEPGTDKELKYNEEGEICISGPTVMKEYLNNPDETDKVLKVHSDGTTWLHLADLGRIDEDGQVYITDRIKNIFMRTGFNVHPSKIEEYINSLPCVKEAKVIGIEHPEQQKVPVAFISLTEESLGKEEQILNSIKEKCYGNLEEMSIPYDWILVDAIPRNLGGKIDDKILVQTSNIDYMKDKTPTLKVLKLKK